MLFAVRLPPISAPAGLTTTNTATKASNPANAKTLKWPTFANLFPPLCHRLASRPWCSTARAGKVYSQTACVTKGTRLASAALRRRQLRDVPGGDRLCAPGIVALGDGAEDLDHLSHVGILLLGGVEIGLFVLVA